MAGTVRVPSWDEDGRSARVRPTAWMGIGVGVGFHVVELGVKAESNSITELVDDYGPVDDVGSSCLPAHDRLRISMHVYACRNDVYVCTSPIAYFLDCY